MGDDSVAASNLRSAARSLSEQLSRVRFLEGADGFEHFRAELKERQRLVDQKIVCDLGPNGPLISVFLGGTNVGKSTMFNLSIGEFVACPSEVARGTRSPAVYSTSDVATQLKESNIFKDYQRLTLQQPSELNEVVGDIKKVYFHTHSRPAFEALALVDAPDLDSNHIQNHETAKDALFCADVVIFVTSNQKYRDAVCEELLARAARLGKRIYVIFNFQTAKAVEDFRKRYRVLTGQVLQDHRLVKVDYAKATQLGSGPWVKTLQDLLPSMITDKEIIKKAAVKQSCLALPDELKGCMDRYRREVAVVEGVHGQLGKALKRRSNAYSMELRESGIPEMDEILTLVMKELSIPGIDRIYDAIFETARSIWTRIRSLLGAGAAAEKVRALRDRHEADRLKRHFNAFIDDIREVFDQVDPAFARPLRKGIPGQIFQRLDEERTQSLATDWRDARRDIIEAARDKILHDLKDKRLLKGFIQASKLAVRSASVVAVFHFGPQPLIDIAGSAVADFGLRSLLDKAFGGHYQKSTEDDVLLGLEARFSGLLSNRISQVVRDGLPKGHNQSSYAELETAIATLRESARE
jgi:hypothetical protein